MTCLSSLKDDPTPLVLDTSVLINLHACCYGERILRAIPNEVFVPAMVVAELDHETSHANGDSVFIQNLISQQIVKVMELDENAYQIYEHLVCGPGSLDDGEAAALALAASTIALPVIDERKGRTRAKALISGKVPAWSLDLIAHPVAQASLPKAVFIDAVHLALRDGRMRIDEKSCDAIVALLGPKRALECSCLPGYKVRRIGWMRELGHRAATGNE
ncbi:MAG TPA: DNA-binding protein [Henriciella sp.]|nr:DNA-binding protein [Henriciella sp.]